MEISSVLNLVPLLAMHSDDLWYALPLVVVISLVYHATRHEHMSAILWGAARFAAWLVGFMVVASAILYFVSTRL